LNAALVAAIAKSDGPMAIGSQGQTIVNPAVVELRLGQQALARLLGSMAIAPADEDQTPIRSMAAAKQRAANARWTRQRRAESAS
jgi:hypothetical protein